MVKSCINKNFNNPTYSVTDGTDECAWLGCFGFKLRASPSL